MADLTRTSVVIPVLNESGVMKKAISRAWAAGAFEVIVVDGAVTMTLQNLSCRPMLNWLRAFLDVDSK